MHLSWNNCIGTQTWPDGREYVGEFRDGKPNGQGTYTWPDGRKYVGEWKDDKVHGQGTHTLPDAQKYIGEFRDGKMHGQGTYTWPDGRKYVGEWKDNKRNGQGTQTWADGQKYVGEFRDEGNGQGTMTRADGSVIHSGLWADGMPVTTSSTTGPQNPVITPTTTAPPSTVSPVDGFRLALFVIWMLVFVGLPALVCYRVFAVEGVVKPIDTPQKGGRVGAGWGAAMGILGAGNTLAKSEMILSGTLWEFSKSARDNYLAEAILMGLLGMGIGYVVGFIYIKTRSGTA